MKSKEEIKDMKTNKQPKNKILRCLKYLWLINCRNIQRDERLERKGLLKCEICGRSEEEGYSICHSCNRCYNRKCNAGCIFCNPEPHPREYCKCCGHKIIN